MISSNVPESWQALQEGVAQILSECRFSAEIEKTIRTVRGEVAVDVYAEEMIKGRKYVILCECKHWKNRVPQTVIHSFRTVVTDSGANIGYIISSAGFQSGAFEAAEQSNIRLVTWEEFQLEFEASWIDLYLVPFVTKRLDRLLAYTEPMMPHGFGALNEDGQKLVIELKEKYDSFGWLMMMFTTYHNLVVKKVPVLPVRAHYQHPTSRGEIPDDILDAIGYQEFLAAAVKYGDLIIGEFREALLMIDKD